MTAALSTPDSPPLLAVDWGSTHLRARLVAGGAVVATASSADGIRHLAGRDCAGVLAELCGSWINEHPGLRVLVSGMAGAREGWREVPYVAAPCGPAGIAAASVAVPGSRFGEVRIVPGVRCDDPRDGSVEVMRGEETQILGLFDSLPEEESVVILPGTHSKWVRCRGGQIVAFRTWLTGEAYDRLTRDSLISGDGSPADPAGPAFARGFDSADAPGGLLRQLFLARTAMLAGRIDASGVRSFVSGLLVAHELREGLGFAGSTPIHLVGDSPAVGAVAAGLDQLGVPHVRHRGDLHLAGILALAGHLGWDHSVRPETS